ncbi:hypothetical protein Dsin_001700 [Dipteronia sinensis]|uniref:Uncharacterized protein n=1 Tax=Dipteronia sinensis TaxID=43782 RepID=A0AAE0B647_9ROSI|nr:hypothetical protein Dsin_001700 [Dipteronia sinensis]
MAKRGKGKGKVQEEDSTRTRQVPQTLVAPQQLIDEDLPPNPTLDSESLEIEGSSDEKKKGRGKAKGVPNNHNLEVHIYQGRSDVALCLLGDWSDVALGSIKPIFKKYLTKEARKAHPPDNVPVKVWEKMVDKWMDEDWQEQSQRNKSNRDSLKMHHTSGSIPIAKYKYEQVKTTGIEPSPIECFKMFHMSKTKDGGKEWTSEQAEALHAKLEAKKATAQDQGFEIDELNIYIMK